jgi:hypothetical protein
MSANQVRTSTSAAPAPAETISATAPETPRPAHRRRTLRRAAAFLAATCTSGAMVLALTGAASAVNPVVTHEPQFDCYSGSLMADKPLIVEDGGTITWQPEIAYYKNGQWQFAAWGTQETVPATVWGETELYNQSFTALHNTYFMVWDWFYTAANGWVSMAARAERGGAPVGSYICQTS